MSTAIDKLFQAAVQNKTFCRKNLLFALISLNLQVAKRARRWFSRFKSWREKPERREWGKFTAKNTRHDDDVNGRKEGKIDIMCRMLECFERKMSENENTNSTKTFLADSFPAREKIESRKICVWAQSTEPKTLYFFQCTIFTSCVSCYLWARIFSNS